MAHSLWSHSGKNTAVVFLLTCSVWIIASPGRQAYGCGGCFRLPYQTLLEKIERADRVVVARLCNSSGLSWRVDQVIKGSGVDTEDLLDVSDATSGMNGPHVLRWNKALSLWAADCAASPELVAFLKGAGELPAFSETMSIRQHAQSLRYFLPYLEHPDVQIADSAHAKLAQAPYSALRELAEHLDHDRLLKWISTQRTAIKQRGALYITLLGVRRDEGTAALLQQWIDQRWAGGDKGYLAAVLTAHVEVHGEEAVRFIEASYLQNPERTLGEIVAAVDALRTHGQAGTRISRERIKSSFHLLIRERAPLAELIIDDFAQWQDWSIAPQLMQIHAGGKQPWNNALIIKYLEACPLPTAKHFVANAMTRAK